MGARRNNALIGFFVAICLLGGELHAAEFFPLSRVQLLDGPFKSARDTDLEYLLKHDVDRLLAPYRKEAGLEPKAESYPNWPALAGSVGGHYLSAMSMFVATTGNEECKRRMDYIVNELAACQSANGNGYAGSVPNGREMWELLAKGDPDAVRKRAVPWYTIHKTFAGLRDAWINGGNPLAKDVLIKFSDWCYDEVKELTPEQMETMLAVEHGGMNEVLADVSVISGDKKYLELAKRFSHRKLLDSMSQGRDELDTLHANTQVPKAVGFQRIAELTGDKKYAEAARFFWETVVDNRTLDFGGNSLYEHFPSVSDCANWVETRRGPETCNTYNMLKLTEGLYTMNPQAKYADYYERALYNHILSSQHPECGGFVYYTPVRPRHYRVYSTVNQGMWCCVGTGMENHAKYGEFIYSHQEDSLFVNLFIASELNWQEKGVQIRQETRFPDESQTTLMVRTDKPVQFTLKIRHPEWVPAGQFAITIGTKTWGAESKPSSYVEIKRVWKDGDSVNVSLPMHISIKMMPNVNDYASILYGPLVLAAKTGTEDLKGQFADYQLSSEVASGELLPLNEAPMLVGTPDSFAKKITPIKGGESLRFKAEKLIKPDACKDLILEPFYRIYDARYMIYWRTTSLEQYEKIVAAAKEEEQQKLLLDKRTIDRVMPGQQQPEANHNMKSEGSVGATFRAASYRHADSPGWFSYDLQVDTNEQLELLIRYWGNEKGQRTFDILVDGEKLVTENIANKWSKDDFIDVAYPLPAKMIKNKNTVTILFKAHPENLAGGIFDIRILKSR